MNFSICHITSGKYSTQLLPSSASSLLRRGFSKHRCKYCCCHQELWSRNCKNSGILQEESLSFVKYHSKCAVNYVQNITCQSKCSVLLENGILISKCFLSKSPKICTWLKVLLVSYTFGILETPNVPSSLIKTQLTEIIEASRDYYQKSKSA